MTRELMRYPARAVLYAMVFAGVLALLAETIFDSEALFLLGSSLIGVSFLGWGIAYLARADWIGPSAEERVRNWIGYLFVATGAFTIGLLAARIMFA